MLRFRRFECGKRIVLYFPYQFVGTEDADIPDEVKKEADAGRTDFQEC